MKRKIIRKWYQLLEFPSNVDERFYAMLSQTDCNSFTDIENYNTKTHTPIENLFAYLYFCENLQNRYAQRNIPQNVLLDTLHDIVIWTNTHHQVHQTLGLSETDWLKRHLSFKLFKVGRLQYCISGSEFDIPKLSLQKGAPIIEIHIPEGEPLLLEKCKNSIQNAGAFFQHYFPEYTYEYYTCHSWLLDENLLSVIDKNSNIALFQTLFCLCQNDISDALLKYVFRWDATRENLSGFPAKSSLAQKIKKAIAEGTIFHETLGYIPKKLYE